MQTFLPFEDFVETARCLDSRRLGKQRVEVLQIYNTLTSDSRWRNHPAVLMWRGHEWWLLYYGSEICAEWRARGYRDSLLRRFLDHIDEMKAEVPSPPPWLGIVELHSSHRANLIRKLPEHYGLLGWTEEPMTGYYWPVRKA